MSQQSWRLTEWLYRQRDLATIEEDSQSTTKSREYTLSEVEECPISLICTRCLRNNTVTVADTNIRKLKADLTASFERPGPNNGCVFYCDPCMKVILERAARED